MASAQNQPWEMDQLRIACAFYFTLPFGRMHKSNPEIVHLAGLLGRTPSSLAMKLAQFASLDPEHRARGIRGLSNAGRMDNIVWTEFQSNWADSLLASQVARDQILNPIDRPTEDIRPTKIRLEQATFRKIVLAAYSSQCCITGNPVPELLIASHILPWSEHPDQRLDPRNGLCLSAEFDKAFDNHLISFDEQFKLLINPKLKRHKSSAYISEHILNREGTEMRLPERFTPEPAYMAQHRQLWLADGSS